MVKTGRPTSTGTGRVVSMKKHTPVTFAKKRAALRCIEATGCMQTVRARFFSDLTNDAWDTKRKQIYAWRKTKATIDALGSCARAALASAPRWTKTLSLNLSGGRLTFAVTAYQCPGSFL